MFVDASAILAILNDEPEAAAFAEALESTTGSITSPIAIFEATVGLCRVRRVTVEDATAVVSEFLALTGVECLPLTADDAQAALVAFGRFGKGRAHPAQLNLGDCFAYAAAHRHEQPLLFKGNDFSRTDIKTAEVAQGSGATPPPA